MTRIHVVLPAVATAFVLAGLGAMARPAAADPAAAPSSPLAEEESHLCHPGALPVSLAPRPGQVRIDPGAGRPYLLADEGGCPTQRSVACQRGTPLQPAEPVAVFHGFRQFVCVARGSAGDGASVGWLPRRSVRTAILEREPEASDWLGSWEGPSGRIGLRAGAETGAFEVDAAAPSGGAWLNGSGRPEGRALAVRDEFGSGCTLTLWLAGPLLVAAGDAGCGGGFDGLYTRVAESAAR